MSEGYFTGKVEIKPNTLKTYPFLIPADSGATVNDGFIEYGRTITDIDVTAYTPDGTNVTTALISGDPTVVNNIVYIKFQYPDGWPTGIYNINIDYIDNEGETDQIPFENIFVKEG